MVLPGSTFYMNAEDSSLVSILLTKPVPHLEKKRYLENNEFKTVRYSLHAGIYLGPTGCYRMLFYHSFQMFLFLFCCNRIEGFPKVIRWHKGHARERFLQVLNHLLTLIIM